MRYLMITHIAAHAGQSPGVIRWPADWVRGLYAQSKALEAEGFDLTVAAPVNESFESRTLNKKHYIDANLKDQPYDLIALPAFQTASQFVGIRGTLKKRVADIADDFDAIQVGPGGHPVSLGQTVWPVIEQTDAKRVLVFGSDPIPAWQRYAAAGRNLAKRIAKQMAVRQLETFCQTAMRDADLVFAGDSSVQQRFATSWNANCHTLFSHRLSESDILTSPPTHTRDKLRLICFGSDHYTRGLDHLIRALAKARRLSAKIELDLVGDLLNSAEMMNLIRDEKLESNVRLLGKIDDAGQIALLDDADLLVSSHLVPTRDPIIYLAAARGLPIVMYQGGVYHDHVVDSDLGQIVPRGEVNLLSQALLDLSRNRPRVQLMSANALAWAKTRSLDAMHRKRAELIRALMK